jgi:hypothetical protein
MPALQLQEKWWQRKEAPVGGKVTAAGPKDFTEIKRKVLNLN